ncbi:gag-pol polyprotein [Trifolium medium]|uniref:Gag-pol polyprotein n=1 Tax=Trifolium medium TaxID=97028 RepID=A0A392LWV7_9FABA|nr:gag-pol polyprotein [Trifolium medium]
MDKEGGIISRSPLLDGNNYDFWKSRMTSFLKSIDNKIWKAVIVGWTHPLVAYADGNPTTEKKPEASWTKEEDDASTWNHKALNALFNGVDKNMFRLIKRCDVAKDA